MTKSPMSRAAKLALATVIFSFGGPAGSATLSESRLITPQDQLPN